jgi:hypothetical protein
MKLLFLLFITFAWGQNLTLSDLQSMALTKFTNPSGSGSRRSVFSLAHSESVEHAMLRAKTQKSARGDAIGSITSMADADPWSHNAFSAVGTMQATLLLPNMPTPTPVPNALKVDPVKKQWYSNAGPLGVQWINATHSFTVQQTPYGPFCWEIPGWNFDKQVAGYKGMFLAGTDGPTVLLSGGVHDVTGCACLGAHTFQFMLIGNQYRLMHWAVEQAYPYLPFGAAGVKINIIPSQVSGDGPTAEDMTVPAMCIGAPSYCDTFTAPSCNFVAHP